MLMFNLFVLEVVESAWLAENDIGEARSSSFDLNQKQHDLERILSKGRKHDKWELKTSSLGKTSDVFDL